MVRLAVVVPDPVAAGRRHPIQHAALARSVIAEKDQFMAGADGVPGALGDRIAREGVAGGDCIAGTADERTIVDRDRLRGEVEPTRTRDWLRTVRPTVARSVRGGKR